MDSSYPSSFPSMSTERAGGGPHGRRGAAAETPHLMFRTAQDIARFRWRSGETVLAELAPEAALADAEQPRRARLHLLRVLERLQDHLALEAVERVIQAETRRLVRGRRPGRAEVEQPYVDGV